MPQAPDLRQSIAIFSLRPGRQRLNVSPAAAQGGVDASATLAAAHLHPVIALNWVTLAFWSLDRRFCTGAGRGLAPDEAAGHHHAARTSRAIHLLTILALPPNGCGTCAGSLVLCGRARLGSVLADASA